MHDPGVGVHRPDARIDAREVVGIHEVDLVEQDQIGERDLLGRLVAVLELALEMARVDEGHDRVEQRFIRHFGIDEEGLRHGSGVSKPRGLQQDCVEFVSALHQPAEDADQVTADGAAALSCRRRESRSGR